MSSLSHMATIKNSALYKSAEPFTATDASRIIKKSKSRAIGVLAEMAKNGDVSIKVNPVGEHNTYQASMGMRQLLRLPIRAHTDLELGLVH